jgi:hypothetical protein
VHAGRSDCLVLCGTSSTSSTVNLDSAAVKLWPQQMHLSIQYAILQLAALCMMYMQPCTQMVSGM